MEGHPLARQGSASLLGATATHANADDEPAGGEGGGAPPPPPLGLSRSTSASGARKDKGVAKEHQAAHDAELVNSAAPEIELVGAEPEGGAQLVRKASTMSNDRMRYYLCPLSLSIGRAGDD